MARNFHFWILFASLFYVIDGHSIADYTTTCSKNDPQLENCILTAAHNLRPRLKKGLKGLRIPPMDPLVIPKVQIASGGGPVSLDSTFTNVKIDGLSTFEMRKVNVDFDKKQITAEAFVPSLVTTGRYDINGKILTLPISGSGDSTSTYSGVNGYLTLKFKPEIRNGKEYWTLEKSDFDLDVQHADIDMDNLFNGNKQLSQTMNTFIAENWQAVFQELKPSVRDTVNAIITDIASKVFKAFPIDELFPQ